MKNAKPNKEKTANLFENIKIYIKIDYLFQ